MSGSTIPIRLVPAVGLLLAVAMTACTVVPGDSAGLDTASPALTVSPVATADPVVTASPSAALTPSPVVTAGPTPEPTVAGVDSPPDALLAAEGGDPVLGQLGTYTWSHAGTDSASDAPWQWGTPMTIGAGEPLTVAFQPTIEIESWRAVYVPARAGPENAVSLGDGTGAPAFLAPDVGRWTVAVEIKFLAGVGTALYFWQLDVR